MCPGTDEGSRTYRYGSIRPSLARRKILRQSGTVHTQISRVNTFFQEFLPSRNVPRPTIYEKGVQFTLTETSRNNQLPSGLLRDDHIFLKGVEEYNVFVRLWNTNI